MQQKRQVWYSEDSDVVGSKPVKPDATLIKHILTLRYSPKTKSKISKLTWKDFVSKQSQNPADFVERTISEHIRQNIKNSNKTRVAIALSGGVDSTLVLDLLTKSVPDVKIKALSVKFQESFDETKQAARLAQKLNVDHQVIYLENYLKELPRAIGIIKLPLWDIHWYYLAKKATTLSKFIVSGDGGDELFGGYTFRYEKFLSLIKRDASVQHKIASYLECHERDWIPEQKEIFGKKISFSWDDIYKIFQPYFDNPLPALEQVFLADFNGKLRHNFSIVNNSINKHFGIKTVSPILSKKMISYATRVPAYKKYDEHSHIGKLQLRQIIKNDGLQKFLTKTKQGFSINTVNLWKSHGKDICDYYLSSARIVRDGWANGAWIDVKLRSTNNDIRIVNKLLGLLALEIWYRLFVTQEMKPTTKLC